MSEENTKSRPSTSQSEPDEGRKTDDGGRTQKDQSSSSSVSRPPSEQLELPKGALIAFRKSGGLKFSSREIVVYPDGRVTYGGGDTAKTALESRATRKLMDAQIMKMRRMLEQSNFFRMTSPLGEQSPDAFAYEIVARVGNKSNQMEVFDGAIPDALMPLIEQMNRLMPSEE